MYFMNIKTQYNQIGKDYIAGHKRFFKKKEDPAIKFIKRNIPSFHNKVVLDLGCGAGNAIKLYEKLGAKSVFGIDASKYMIEAAKKNLPHNKDLFVGDIEKTGLRGSFFDVVVSRYAMHYLRSFNKAWKEIARILKKDGTLVFVADHPLKSFILQESKEYGKKEIIKMELFNDGTIITFPTHTFQEYLSKDFFQRFRLDNFEEWHSAEANKDDFNMPDSLGIKAIKR